MAKKILVVDDENTVRSLLKIYLTKAGFELDFAEDGIQAMEKIRSFDPDVVVLDTNMPGKNGIEVCSETKAANPSRPKIIFHTGSLEEYKAKAEAAGADATFAKTAMGGLGKLVELINTF
ncbi:MAG: response regulator [Bacteroidetes bacterium]|nr:response regulator [Bacteroidota bacterium]